MTNRTAFIPVTLMLGGSLLGIGLYFAVFSYLIGSHYGVYANRGDVVNMLSFAFILTALLFSLFSIERSAPKGALCAALGVLVFIMVLVISIGRYLAVHPESGAGGLFIYVGILDFLTAIVLPIGLGRVVGWLLSPKQSHD